MRYNILIIPSWFPNTNNIHNGIFIKKHVDIIASIANVKVAFISESNSIANYSSINDSVASNYEIFNIDLNKSGSSKYLYLFDLFKTFKKLNILIQRLIASGNKPDIIHVHVAYPAGLFALYLNWKFKIPYVITEHWSGYTPVDNRFNNFSSSIKWVIRKIYKKATAHSFISKFLKRELIKLNLSTEAAIVIPNVIELDSTRQLTNKSNPNYGLCICSLDDFSKNISGILEAVNILKHTISNIKIDIIGDGIDRAKLESIADDFSILNKHVFFLGEIPNTEIPDQYSSHSFFILNSNFETYSIATAEAICNGLPVIVTRCGGPEEFVNDENGVLVNLKDPFDLAKGITYVIQNRDIYDGELMSKNFLRNYDTENIKQGFNQLYNSTLDS